MPKESLRAMPKDCIGWCYSCRYGVKYGSGWRLDARDPGGSRLMHAPGQCNNREVVTSK